MSKTADKTAETTAPEVRSFPMPRPTGCPFAEPEQFRHLREAEPVSRGRLWDGNEVWLVARYEDQRDMINDPRFSAEPSRPGYPLVSPAQKAVLGGASSFVFKDHPEHNRLRRAVTPEFTITRIETMRPRIQQIVDGAVDDLLAAGPGADLVKLVGLPVPTMVICELLGVPYAQRDFFRQRNAILNSRDCAPETASNAHCELYQHIDEIVSAKEREPGDDLISRVLEEQVRPGTLSRSELVINALLLMLAGQEPTMCMIGLGATALLSHPEQFAALGASQDPVVGRPNRRGRVRTRRSRGFRRADHAPCRRRAADQSGVAVRARAEQDGARQPDDLGAVRESLPVHQRVRPLGSGSEHIVKAAQYGVHFSNGYSDGNAFHALATIGELIESGRFWLPVDRTFPLAEITEAHRVSETGRVRGRLVLLLH